MPRVAASPLIGGLAPTPRQWLGEWNARLLAGLMAMWSRCSVGSFANAIEHTFDSANVMVPRGLFGIDDAGLDSGDLPAGLHQVQLTVRALPD